MAHKSKTQRAKATVAKANRKDRLMREEAAGVNTSSTEDSASKASLTKTEKKDNKEQAKKKAVATTKKEDKPKKVRFQFLRDVRAEMKRVTWPSRQDVVRWSGVVVGALLFFGVYVAVLDNVIITPALVALSGLGA